MQGKRIYLDFNATTPIAREVAAAINQALETFGMKAYANGLLPYSPGPLRMASGHTDASPAGML